MATTDPTYRTSVRVPVSVYVMWHPAFTDGPVLASAIHDWLGPSHPDLREVGLVPPVYFRSEDWQADYALPGDPIPARTAPADAMARADQRARTRMRRPIDFDRADVHLLVPLVDPHMLADRSWQRDLARWGARHRTAAGVHLTPVQLVPSLSSLGADVAATPAIQVDGGPGSGAEEGRAPRLARRIVRLRRAVMQRVLYALTSPVDVERAALSTPLRRVFVSRDPAEVAGGASVADALHEAARAYGHLETLSDDPALQARTRQSPSRARAGDTTREGFVAVLGDRYGRHATTRSELARARAPRIDGRPHPDTTVWTVRPTVAVSTLDRQWTRIPDDLATVPVLRYSPGREAEVFDGLLREAMVQAYQVQWARKVAQLWPSLPEAEVYTHAHIITWSPDRPTLSALRAEARRQRTWPAREGERVLVLTPGFGFFPDEDARLERDFGAEAELRSIADMLSPPPAPTYSGTRIWFSSAEAPEAEQAARGYDTGTFLRERDVRALLRHDALPDLARRGSGHVDAAILRIIRRVVPGADLAIGGPLRGGTATTFDHAVDLLSDPRLVSGRPSDHRPLLVAVPWPHHGAESAADRQRVVHQRARSARVCRFYDIPSPEPPTARATEADAGDAADDLRWRAATSKSRMRRVLARRTDVTLCAGGRPTGYDGLMPDVFEEILTSFRAQVSRGGAPSRASRSTTGPGARRLQALTPADVSVLLIGELGGAARVLVQAILAPVDAPLHTLLTFRGQLEHPDNQSGIARTLARHPSTERHVRRAYDQLAAVVTGLRALVRADPDTLLPALGIRVAAWRQLLTTTSVATMETILAGAGPGVPSDSRRVPSLEAAPLQTRLIHALAATLVDGVPNETAFEAAFPGALAADEGSLARAIGAAAQPEADLLDAATVIHHHLNVQSPELWRLLAEQRPGGSASVRTALAAFDLPMELVRTLRPDTLGHRGRLAVHLVWHTDDDAGEAIAAELTHLLTTLGDGTDRPGRGVSVRHWPYTAWPPADPDYDACEDHVVVLLWQLDRPTFASEAFRASPWVSRLVERRLRVCQAVHVPAEQLASPPAGFLSEGYRELLWSTASRSPDAAADGPVGTREDVLSAVLWATTLALRPTPDRADRAAAEDRLAFVLDHRPPETVHPTLDARFVRRRCLIRQAPGQPDVRVASATSGPPPLFDAEVWPTAACSAGASSRPRVVVGHRLALEADDRWTHHGRLTVHVPDADPAAILLASHLVVARQRWLHDTLVRAHAWFGGWSAHAAPGLLGLCGHANRRAGPVLVPEPAPSATDRAALADLHVELEVHSPLSVVGPVLRGRTVALACTPPTATERTRHGLRAGESARVVRVLRHVLTDAGARVVDVDDLGARAADHGSPPFDAVVVLGLRTGGPADALATLATSTQVAVWPLGVLGGAFGTNGAALALGWPALWTDLGAHNGLGAGQTAILASTVDVWDAAELLLEGAARLP